jgi:hypothetical protein
MDSQREAQKLLRLARICFRQALQASDPGVARSLNCLGNTHLARAKEIHSTIDLGELA